MNSNVSIAQALAGAHKMQRDQSVPCKF